MPGGLARLAGVAFLVGKSRVGGRGGEVFGSYVLPCRPLLAASARRGGHRRLNIAGVALDRAERLGAGRRARWRSLLFVAVLVGLVGQRADRSTSSRPPQPSPRSWSTRGPAGVLTAAGLLFFAFAGYARLATLGGRRATPSAPSGGPSAWRWASRCWSYLLGSRWPCSSGWARIGSPRQAAAPLAALVDAGGAPGSVCSSGSGRRWRPGSALLSVLVGDQPDGAGDGAGAGPAARWRGSARAGTLWRADLARRGGRVRSSRRSRASAAAIALSACSCSCYYGVINVAALRLSPAARGAGRAGVRDRSVLCVLLALLLPLAQVLITAAALAVGWTAATFRSPVSAR